MDIQQRRMRKGRIGLSPASLGKVMNSVRSMVMSVKREILKAKEVENLFLPNVLDCLM